MHISTSAEITVRNPATGDVIGCYPEIDADTLRGVIARAREAQPAWAALTLKQRREHVKRMRDWLVDHADAAASIISNCTGKTPLEALAFDVTPAIFSNAWYCKHARKHLAPERIAPGNILMLNKRSTLFRKPFGVIGVISPWNYPLGIPMHEIVPALLAGNTVVFKTAPETIPVGELIEAMCKSAGFPDNVFQHVIVDGPICGDVMLEANGVNKLFFTGSVRVGKILAEKAARNLIPVSLELGGKDAMIVLDDANIERAARGAVWGGMQNAGQSCAGVERVYVQEAVYEKFLAAIKTQVEKLHVWGPSRTGSDMGVLTTERQVATVKSHIEGALTHGAVIHAQGKAEFDSPQMIAPTVLVNVNHNMRVMREETFGPVIGIMPFKTEDEAIELANDSPYGLTGSVWSSNKQRAERIAKRIHAGAITINDHLMSHGLTETPWGGPKESGIGRGHGKFAFEEVTDAQVVIHDWLGFAPKNLWWYPYSADAYQGMKSANILLYGKGLRRRLRAGMKFLRGVTRMFRR